MISIRRLSRRTRVPGFRPGKAPRSLLERVLGSGAVLDEAVDQLVETAYRDALAEAKVIPLARPEVEVIQAEEGKPFIFKATVPVRPEITLGDYRGFNFRPEIDPVDDAKVDRVIEELRDQHAMLDPVEDRGAAKGDYAVIGFTGTRAGLPFEGGSAERVPLIIGQERLIPGFEDHLLGLNVGESTEFDLTFPADYAEETLAGAGVHFAATVRELRQKVLPEANDAFAQGIGSYADMAALRIDVRQRLDRSGRDQARHAFADRIIEYAIANATCELPDVLVDDEVEVMHDELRSTLARQGITEDAYLKATEQTPEQLHGSFRPNAEKRAKVLLVLWKIAEAEGIDVAERDIVAEIERARVRYAGNSKLIAHFESERGRNAIRSSLRRTRVVEKLVDDWLAAHPEQEPIPHLEDSVEHVPDEAAEGERGALAAAQLEP